MSTSSWITTLSLGPHDIWGYSWLFICHILYHMISLSHTKLWIHSRLLPKVLSYLYFHLLNIFLLLSLPCSSSGILVALLVGVSGSNLADSIGVTVALHLCHDSEKHLLLSISIRRFYKPTNRSTFLHSLVIYFTHYFQPTFFFSHFQNMTPP